MRYALMTEPQQGLSYEEILSLARAAEEAGMEAFFRSDHYASFPGEGGLPTTDAWATLAGLARETSTSRRGDPVSPVSEENRARHERQACQGGPVVGRRQAALDGKSTRL